jgi:hypothetical protein
LQRGAGHFYVPIIFTDRINFMDSTNDVLLTLSALIFVGGIFFMVLWIAVGVIRSARKKASETDAAAPANASNPSERSSSLLSRQEQHGPQ